jgi:hypothetical protein
MAPAETRPFDESDKRPPNCGQRLVPTIIDERASTHPTQPFASIPVTSSPQDGFRDINYAQLANAINRLAWWIEETLGKGVDQETLTYIGPNDLRYAILTVAAIKTGYKVSFTVWPPGLGRLIGYRPFSRHLATASKAIYPSWRPVTLGFS